MKIAIIAVVMCFLLFGCSTEKFRIDSEVVYERIGLDYWNVQYFDIKGYNSVSDSILIEKIIEFSQQELSFRNIMPPKIDIQNFYDKKWYRSSCNNLHDEAIDGEGGLPNGCGDLLISDIWYHKKDSINNTYTRNTTVYSRGNKTYFISSREDLLKINGTKWILLKQGKIEKKIRLENK